MLVDETVKAPNEEYIEMTFAKETATGKGLNNRFVMENCHDGTFLCTEGRIGITIGCHKPKSYRRPIADWHHMYSRQIGIGYTLFSEKKTEAKKITKQSNMYNGIHFKTIAEKSVNAIVTRLIELTNNLMQTEYTVKVENISEEMLNRGSALLDELADKYKDMSVAEFNNKLKTLYAIIPRRIDNLNKKLAKRPADFQDIVAREQELYDVMKSQTNECTLEKDEGKTILEALGIEWRDVTPEEESWIRKQLAGQKYVKAWRITNIATEKRFNDFCKRENLTEDHGIERLFHGSRSANFWSIITTGLTINPKGVPIQGKMFGYGTYFAPDACKSMGYSDRYGSRWANGAECTGFLGIYKVAVGNPCEPRNVGSYNYESLHKNGYHSVWCKRGGQIGLRMDEVVVYQDCQDTIEYLVEVG